eukprot:TRINITY_DN26477_c0_g1_i2.p1 TRINITY_DN26477_c0_g1~~TRINITY_DN26477_c0_g1_i2.p1  ORF type:complete len:535 (+),score=51.61 TRINITY_DN26477_c0_g1_i2:158-1762(+)
MHEWLVGLLPLVLASATPHAMTSCGGVDGLWEGSTAAFLGIPYALPPIGDRRWKPPVPMGHDDCWSGRLQATAPGAACLQRTRFGSGLNVSEDCLKLHVHTSNLGASRGLRPVVVWLHGGDLVEGSSFTIQSGFGSQANLTRNNRAVVVSVEYRLNVPGFLSLEALGAQGANYGLLDVIQALRWVQQNIFRFGGDPDRVTVWGQSSGGSLVYALLASPSAAGLFSAGFTMSGSPRLNSTVSEAQNYWHREVVAQTRCEVVGFQDPARLRECMYSLNATELMDSIPESWSADGWSLRVFDPAWRYAPLLLIDGHGGSLPYDYISAFNGSTPAPSKGVPLVIGVTQEESDFSPGDDVRNATKKQFGELITKSFGLFYGSDFVEELVEMYVQRKGVQWEPQQVYSDIITDATTLCPSLHLADAMRVGGSQPVYMYGVSQAMNSSTGFCALQAFNHFQPPYCPKYSFHAADMFAVFQPAFHPTRFNYSFTPVDIAFGRHLEDKILEFAEFGRIMQWPHFSEERKTIDLAVPERETRAF